MYEHGSFVLGPSYSQVANRRGVNTRGQKFFQLTGGLNKRGGVGNQPLKRKNLLRFIAKLSLIRLVDESCQVKMLQIGVK